MPWTGSTHPINHVRVERLKEELKRWERKRQQALKARAEEQAKQAREQAGEH